jgi:hypothetical protein
MGGPVALPVHGVNDFALRALIAVRSSVARVFHEACTDAAISPRMIKPSVRKRAW